MGPEMCGSGVGRADYSGKLALEACHVLAVELASRESRSSWKGFLETLKARGLHGSSSSSPTIRPG